MKHFAVSVFMFIALSACGMHHKGKDSGGMDAAEKKSECPYMKAHGECKEGKKDCACCEKCGKCKESGEKCDKCKAEGMCGDKK